MRAAVIAVLLFGLPSLAEPAAAQVRGFADLGATMFSAAESFEAVFGSRTGVVFGGGMEVGLPSDLFVTFRASRFQRTGHRVFVFEGEVFDLDVRNTVTVTPIVLGAGYRFMRAARRVVPYVGGGIGWHRFTETSEFASDDEAVDETLIGAHVFGGLEFRISRLIGTSGEADWSTVPDALGDTPGGAAAAFGEDNLGGFTMRVKVVIGR